MEKVKTVFVTSAGHIHDLVPEQYCTGPAECIQCSKEWTAVWCLGGIDLKCPECGSTDTIRDLLDD